MVSHPLTIGIDASRAFQARPTGTERYSTEILNHLVGLGAHRYLLYHRSQPEQEVPGGSELRVLSAPRMWTHTAFARALFVDRPDVFFVPAHVLPLVYPRIPSVVTVHDVGFRHYPGAHPLARRLYLDWTTGRHARLATRLIAVSEATRREMITSYGADPARVRVVYEAADPALGAPNAESVYRARAEVGLGSDAPYLLSVGTVQPRKNLRRLLHAFARLAAMKSELRLVVAGAAGWGREDLAGLAASLGIAERVHLVGYVPRETLMALYGGASVAVIPSLYEGFGLPVLEAMACGAPVVTTTGGSLPEIAGGAAVIADPLDVESLAAAMSLVLDDANLRAELIQKGFRRAREFSWERAARETLEVLEEAAALGVPGGTAGAVAASAARAGAESAPRTGAESAPRAGAESAPRPGAARREAGSPSARATSTAGAKR